MYKITTDPASFAASVYLPGMDHMYAGIIHGLYKGQIWADHVQRPGFWAIWSDFLKGFYFGESQKSKTSDQEILDFINTELICFLREANLDYLEYSCSSSALEQKMLHLLTDKNVQWGRQNRYKAVADTAAHLRTSIRTYADEYQVYSVTQHFMKHIVPSERIDISIMDEFLSGIWNSAEDYYLTGKAYVAVHKKKAVAVSIAGLLFDNTFDIGIRTDAEHRCRGLAKMLTNKLLRQLLEEGYQISWDCTSDNNGSIQTALACGLSFDYCYWIYWYQL